jgi:hypothetical protein
MSSPEVVPSPLIPSKSNTRRGEMLVLGHDVTTQPAEAKITREKMVVPFGSALY